MLTIENKAEQVQKAYSAFLEVHTLANPLPVLKTAKTERSDNVMLFGIFIVLVGATIASASHTIPTLVKDASFIGQLVGVAFFVMIELAIIIFAFFYTRISGSANIEQVKVLAKRGLGFVLMIAIGANLHYVMKDNGFAVLTGDASIAWKLFDFAVSVLFALSAPIVAFISGEVMAITLAYRNNAQSRLDAEYAKQVEAWRASANEAWSHQKRNWGGSVRVESVPVGALNGVSTLLDGRTTNSGRGYTRVSTASEKVKAYIQDNPDSINLPVRELATLIGVGKTTVASVMADIKADSL